MYQSKTKAVMCRAERCLGGVYAKTRRAGFAAGNNAPAATQKVLFMHRHDGDLLRPLACPLPALISWGTASTPRTGLLHTLRIRGRLPLLTDLGLAVGKPGRMG